MRQFYDDRDDEAFTEIDRRYSGRIAAWAVTLGVPQAEADDVVQDTLYSVLMTREGVGAPFNPELARFSTWLYVIARHHSMDWHRLHRREIPMSADDEQGYEERIEAVAGDPLEGLEAEERRAAFEFCFEKLPEQSQRVAQLRYAGGLSYKAIAAATHLIEKTVATILHRAVKKLSECITLRTAQNRARGAMR